MLATIFCSLPLLGTVLADIERQPWGEQTRDAFIRTYYYAGTPVVLTDVPKLTTPEELFHRIPDEYPVVYEYRAPGHLVYDIKTRLQEGGDHGYKHGNWKKFLDDLTSETSSSNVYLTLQNNADAWAEVLGSDLLAGPTSFTQYVEGLEVFSYNMWCGRQHESQTNATNSPLHQDFQDNLYYLVQGEKEFRLVHPDADVYTVGRHCEKKGIESAECMKEFGPPHFSLENTEELEARGVAVHRISLSAGELLYMPARWYHEVHSKAGAAATRSSGRDFSRIHLALNAWIQGPLVHVALDRQLKDNGNNGPAWYSTLRVARYIRKAVVPSWYALKEAVSPLREASTSSVCCAALVALGVVAICNELR
jgi:hypothetical protein